MSVHANGPKWQTLGLIFILSVCAAANVSAQRLIRFDEGDSFSLNGTIWDDVITVSNPSSAIFIDLSVFPIFPDDTSDPSNIIDYPDTNAGFSVFYGTTQDSLNILPEGYISFGDTAVVPGVASGALVDNVASPFYLNGVTASELSYAKGLIDVVGGPTHLVENAVRAFRVTWKIPAAEPGLFFPFQLVLLDMSAQPGRAPGDFDMEFNYQDTGGGTAPAGALLTAGFLLGTNFPGFTWPFTEHGFQTFQFHEGVLVASTTPVPEPNTLPLVLTGLLLIVAGIYRRRIAPQPAR